MRSPDHPHAGGENAHTRPRAGTPGGPSPRGWGEPGRGDLDRRRPGTIPTRVGRTGRAWFGAARTEDHPHAGGENSRVYNSFGNRRGPSPRGWGEPTRQACERLELRTIPTRGGRRGGGQRGARRGADHPHAGGENVRGRTPPGAPHGPSPRGWGEPAPDSRGTRTGRTIPTRVGRTAARVLCARGPADHPHAGGENSNSAPRRARLGGPSPRGWGERGADPTPVRAVRTIPTRVGRTPPADNSNACRADHPHAGGENLFVTRAVVYVDGPSPRGWGEPLH